MARKMARKSRRTAHGVADRLARTYATVTVAPLKLTRGHVTARSHKDLSTHELNCRIDALNGQECKLTGEVDRLTSELARLRKEAKTIREDVVALEGLVESRR